MGYNARNDEIRDNVTRMRREWEARRVKAAFIGSQFEEVIAMRALTLILTMSALFGQGGAALAQQDTKQAAVEAMPVEKVLNANPEADGKASIFYLARGSGWPIRFSPSEAAKIADGMSKPASAAGQNKQVATIVSGMTIQTDSEGKAVIVSPRSQSGVLEPLQFR